MARLAGLRLRDRWGGRSKNLSVTSPLHVSARHADDLGFESFYVA
jgi:hypothetical protein